MREFLGLPPDWSENGHHIDSIILGVHWVILPLFIGFLVYFGYVLFRFRSGRQLEAAKKAPRGRFAMLLIAAIAIGELSVLFFIEIPLWAKRTSDLPTAEEATLVRVIGEQFVWNFHYPGEDGIFGPTSPDRIDGTNPVGLDFDAKTAWDDVVTVNQLHLPIDKPVLLELTAKDVIHAFYIPYLRVKQDVIPGQMIPISFVPKQVGSTEIGCAQLCGLGHFRMKAFLTLETREEFENWYEEELEYM